MRNRWLPTRAIGIGSRQNRSANLLRVGRENLEPICFNSHECLTASGWRIQAAPNSFFQLSQWPEYLLLQLTWMTPHKLPSSLRTVEVDFLEILAHVENNGPESHERSGEQVIGSAKRCIAARPLRIDWSSPANMFFVGVALLGALVGSIYLVDNPEYFRRLHTRWPGEFLYPRPGTEKQSSEMIGQTSSRVRSTSARHARQKPEVIAIFRDLASANPIPLVSPDSLASSNFLSQPVNQMPDTLSHAGRSVAGQSTNVAQRAISAMHSVTSERTRSCKSRQESSAAMSRKISNTRQDSFDRSFASGARQGNSMRLASMRSMSANADHVQTRMTMTGGLIAHALHAGDLGGNVQLRHHGARR
jgi:hypothetical protein